MVRWAALPTLLLDVPLDSRAEQEFAAALFAASPDLLATVPDGDDRTLAALTALGGTVARLEVSDVKGQIPNSQGPISDLNCLRRYLFQTERPAERERAALFRRVAEFFEVYDLLVAPGASTPAFDVNLRMPAAIDGRKLAMPL